ncbi:MAG: hypothetical protein WC269_02185 [Candidatus Gracilibacteria bacterium]|jgi:hypothetical protein
MPIFKYTVVNKEGKKLVGTIETGDQNSAKQELNALGFSVLEIEELKGFSTVQSDQSLLKFSFEAIDKAGKQITGTIPAHSKEEAINRLVREYDLTVTAIYSEGARQEEVQKAREEGIKGLSGKKTESELLGEVKTTKSEIEKQKDQLFREKIDFVLAKIYELVKTFDKDISPDQKSEINKKIDKLLRIKGSTNYDYILETTKDILKFIQSQEKSFRDKGLTEKKIQLEFESKVLMDELKRASVKDTSIKGSLGEKIKQMRERVEQKKQNAILGIFKKILDSLEKMFETPPEVLILEGKIKGYNTQLWELLQLYLKEPTKEYKDKVKSSLITVWDERKKAKEDLKVLRKRLKEAQYTTQELAKHTTETPISGFTTPESFSSSFAEEVTSFSGWLLGVYLIYYFTSLYLTTKDFGLGEIPRGFFFYDSHIFKYLLTILFLMHCSLSIKLTFFRQNTVATIVIVPVFFLSSVIALLNY